MFIATNNTCSSGADDMRLFDRIPYENIQSINGFKWESEWKVVVDETTDADGYVRCKV